MEPVARVEALDPAVGQPQREPFGLRGNVDPGAVRLRLGGRRVNQYEGWYVDDVNVFSTAAPAATAARSAFPAPATFSWVKGGGEATPFSTTAIAPPPSADWLATKDELLV